MTRDLARSLGFGAIDSDTVRWLSAIPPVRRGLDRTMMDGLRRLLGSALRWLNAAPVRLDRKAEADRLFQRWGDLAPDVARAMASRESAGLFDQAETGFWSEVAGEIERRRDEGSSLPARNGVTR